MPSAPITLLATWEAEPGAAEEIARLLPRLVEATRAEPGCMLYEAYRVAGEPTRFVLVERYRDETAVEAHRSSDHFREIVVGRIAPHLVLRRVERLEATE